MLEDTIHSTPFMPGKVIFQKCNLSQKLPVINDLSDHSYYQIPLYLICLGAFHWQSNQNFRSTFAAHCSSRERYKSSLQCAASCNYSEFYDGYTPCSWATRDKHSSRMHSKPLLVDSHPNNSFRSAVKSLYIQYSTDNQHTELTAADECA